MKRIENSVCIVLCMCIIVYIYIYIGYMIYVYMYICIYVYMYICIYVYMYIESTMLVSQDVLQPWDWLGMKETFGSQPESAVSVLHSVWQPYGLVLS